MATSTTSGPVAAGAGGPEPPGTSAPRKKRRRVTGVDRVVIAVFALVPLLLVLALVWLPAVASVVLSFGRWNGIGGVEQIEWIGTQNYSDIFSIYLPFWPAIQHNVIWLVVLLVFPTILGMLLAVLLDRELRGSRIYQTAYFLPTVLSLALTGFIWQLIYSKDQGLLNAVLGTETDWYGDPSVNLWAVLVAASWKHTGYIMLLYLAGLKSVDPSLREAALMDGANERQTFFKVVFPVLRPVNLLVLIVTMIESLRAFDLAWVINKGRNGLELISTLVTSNITGEASRIGFGSALATIMLAISSVTVVVYLRIVMKENAQ